MSTACQCPVKLRNGEIAWLIKRVRIEPFEICGRREQGAYELWRCTGHWREDKTEHPLDIVEGIMPDGKTFPFTPANAAHIL